MSTNINELMNVLASAKEAQDAVPAMRNELARLTRALEASQSEANRYKQASEDIGVELHSAKSLASKLGDERDEAMFHALELEEKLGSITKVLGSALGLVEPPAAREIKATEEAPTPKTEEHPAPQAQAQTHSATDTYHAYEPIHSYDHDNWAPKPVAPEVASTPNPSPEADRLSGQQGYTDSLTASTPTSSLEVEASTPTADASGHTPEAKPPYQGVRWQDKPGYLSWSNFIDQGGEKPYWM